MQRDTQLSRDYSTEQASFVKGNIAIASCDSKGGKLPRITRSITMEDILLRKRDKREKR